MNSIKLIDNQKTFEYSVSEKLKAGEPYEKIRYQYLISLEEDPLKIPDKIIDN